MFGIGGTELLVILVVALLVLGPKSVPQIARTLGKAMGEFRRVSTEFQRTLNTEIAMEELEKTKVPPTAPTTETPNSSEPATPNLQASSAKSSSEPSSFNAQPVSFAKNSTEPISSNVQTSSDQVQTSSGHGQVSSVNSQSEAKV